MEQRKDEAVRMIKNVFPNVDDTKFFAGIDENGLVEIRLKDRKDNLWYQILDEDGDFLTDDDYGAFSKGKKTTLPPKLRKALGKTVTKIIRDNTDENERADERIKELGEQRENAFPEDYDRIDERIREEQEGKNDRNQEIKAFEEKLSLRQRIKEIFKKYGFTVIAVSAAIATVIGVIVSNLKAGLTKVAQGVGNGLKSLGKKLGQILPGMIGAIASFIFRTAGEVIGFLAKNAWLLIVGLAVFAVEQLRNKKR